MMNDIPQYQHRIDEFCAHMLKKRPDDQKLIDLILKWKPSAAFWKDHFEAMYAHHDSWSIISNCPISIAQNHGVKSKLLHTVCIINWRDLCNDEYELDFLAIFKAIETDPDRYSHLIPYTVKILQYHLRNDSEEPRVVLASAAAEGIHISKEMNIFIHGYMYYEWPHGDGENDMPEEVKQLGLQMMRLAYRYSDYSYYLDLPDDKYRSDMTWTDIASARVDMEFLRAYYDPANGRSPGAVPRDQYWRNYHYEAPECLDCIPEQHHNPTTYAHIIVNAEGSFLAKLLDSPLRESLISHPLYQYLSMCKGGRVQGITMEILYDNIIMSKTVFRRLKPSMMKAIWDAAE